MDTNYCLDLLNWPCATQSEWAAWIQVSGAAAALFLSIYVPVRMRRIEELDRREAIAACINMLDQISEHYVSTLPTLENVIARPPIELDIALDACKAHISNPSTPAQLLATLGHAVLAGGLIKQHWDFVAENPSLRENSQHLNTARTRRDRVAVQLKAARAQLSIWRRKHCLALIFS